MRAKPLRPRSTAIRDFDTSPEQAFDDIVRLAAQLRDAPIVAVNLIDAHRQWFKAEIGLGVREMPLDDSICKFALLETDRRCKFGAGDGTVGPRCATWPTLEKVANRRFNWRVLPWHL